MKKEVKLILVDDQEILFPDHNIPIGTILRYRGKYNEEFITPYSHNTKLHINLTVYNKITTTKLYLIDTEYRINPNKKYGELTANNFGGDRGWKILNTPKLFPSYREVLVTSDNLGIVYDHKDSKITQLDFVHIQTILNNSGKCFIDIKENGEMDTVEGKVIIYLDVNETEIQKPHPKLSTTEGQSLLYEFLLKKFKGGEKSFTIDIQRNGILTLDGLQLILL